MYDYTTERKFIFTEAGVEMVIKARDRVNNLLAESGAFREQEAISGLGGDSWKQLACIDYLVERGEIRRIYDKGARQHNVYVKN
jgi:hypothetical protein